ncbi:MAG TPA: tRNA (guanosine(37)-N1)-methyltransferase TrmD [Spirochaetota bacterium]|nr:tRNA (guanosine(37)-N1)-methyltransferase TrmD [Spirochaetota bacterium]HOR44867.1 tRNA (guanosine(37)-N1)-methyltransferase TrmD [Spirochaetota bacterium]HPK55525.1 tRNA (guanosine(37)-N1)-methyltransferase TrmD [Spirochaetota bacterium]HQE59995.1 tRNA (guanosine(37)-N1)-methyltransferase TrmD [Spirochaetota bacterium]
MKHFKIVTLFPAFFDSPLKSSLLGKAINSGVIKTDIYDLRNYSEDKFKRCDDAPYGGGSGMVLMPGPLFNCMENIKSQNAKVILASAGGTPLTQNMVKELSAEEELIIICGHYEGVDQRVIDRYVDIEVSVGDYVLSGGEYAALIIMDAAARLEKGFMSNSDSLLEESFENDLLEYPHYTRPSEIDGMKVPEILLSGDHAKIRKWRLMMSEEKTSSVRPDLYRKYLNMKEGEQK